MQQIIRSAIQARPARRTPYFRLPPLLSISMLLVIGFLLTVITLRTVANQLSDRSLSEPFAPYADIFPGQHVDARQLETQGFSCRPDSRPAPSDTSEECLQRLQTGPLTYVSVTLWDGIVQQLNFAVRENALAIGDLILLWGTPENAIRGKWMTSSWRTPDTIIRIGWALRVRFSQFQTIKVISFEIAT